MVAVFSDRLHCMCVKNQIAVCGWREENMHVVGQVWAVSGNLINWPQAAPLYALTLPTHNFRNTVEVQTAASIPARWCWLLEWESRSACFWEQHRSKLQLSRNLSVARMQCHCSSGGNNMPIKDVASKLTLDQWRDLLVKWYKVTVGFISFRICCWGLC